MTTVLDRYGKVLGELAADGRGEGRLVSVTFLSQQMPFGGRDTAGGLRFASSAVCLAPASAAMRLASFSALRRA